MSALDGSNRCDFFSDTLTDYLQKRLRGGIPIDTTLDDLKQDLRHELTELVTTLAEGYAEWPKEYGDATLYRLTIYAHDRYGAAKSVVKVGVEFKTAIERLGDIAGK